VVIRHHQIPHQQVQIRKLRKFLTIKFVVFVLEQEKNKLQVVIEHAEHVMEHVHYQKVDIVKFVIKSIQPKKNGKGK
jgi:ABC-type histidine transport system ATPase subunit